MAKHNVIKHNSNGTTHVSGYGSTAENARQVADAQRNRDRAEKPAGGSDYRTVEKAK
jgi:hypothetical protein